MPCIQENPEGSWLKAVLSWGHEMQVLGHQMLPSGCKLGKLWPGKGAELDGENPQDDGPTHTSHDLPGCDTSSLDRLWGHSEPHGRAVSSSHCAQVVFQPNLNLGRGPFWQIKWWKWHKLILYLFPMSFNTDHKLWNGRSTSTRSYTDTGKGEQSCLTHSSNSLVGHVTVQQGTTSQPFVDKNQVLCFP